MRSISLKTSCLLLVLLAGCAVEVTDDPSAGPNASPNPGHLVDEDPELGRVSQALITANEFCPFVMTIGSQPAQKVPFCRSRDIYTTNTNVTRAIIVVHGSEREAIEAYTTIREQADGPPLNLDMNTVDIIAPQFLRQEDITSLGLGNEFPRWTSTWQYGQESVPPNGTSDSISSFEVLDHVLLQLTNYRPNLKHVVVVGISAGARMVSRWATVVNPVLRAGVTISYWSVGAGSYMFTGTWRPYGNVEMCGGTDAWKYPWGVENRQAYPYMLRGTAATLRQNESNRMIYWSVGTNDVIDPKDDECFQTQGTHRRERWLHHATSVQNECSTFATVDECVYQKQVTQRSIEIPDCGHSLSCAAESMAGSNLLFAQLAFSSSAKVPGMPFCVQILESADLAGTWGDNWLCSNIDMKLRWSSAGRLAGMQCTQINEPAEPASKTWNDNYLCLPTPKAGYNNIPLRWSHSGKVPGRQCVQFEEKADPHTWNDNYLCW